MNDEQLVSTYLGSVETGSGETGLLDELMLRHLAKVRSIVFRMVLDEGSVDDLTQEVFLKAFRNLHSFEGKSQFATWLYRVAMNVVHDFLRKERRTPVKFRAEITEAHSTAAEPQQAAMQSELMSEVQRALSELSPALRAAMVLTVLDRHSPKEAAEIEDCTVDTMHWRIHEARKQLKQRLDQFVK